MTQSHSYPNEQILATPQWLVDRLQEPGVKVIDARSAKDYQEGHILGAIVLPGRVFKAEDSFETCSPDEFAQFAGSLGVRPGDTVVSYDANGPQSARVWWAFTRFGHREVRFLHGGIRQWQAAGYPLVTESTPVEPVTYTLGEQLPHLACSLPQAVDSLGKEGVLFWDVRTPGEYTGEDGRGNPPDRVGHVPGAVHLEWTDLTVPATGLFKPPDEMRRILEAKGITPDREVIAY